MDFPNTVLTQQKLNDVTLKDNPSIFDHVSAKVYKSHTQALAKCESFSVDSV